MKSLIRYYPFVLKNCGLDGVCHGSNKTLMKKVILTEDVYTSMSPAAQRGLRGPTEKGQAFAEAALSF